MVHVSRPFAPISEREHRDSERRYCEAQAACYSRIAAAKSVINDIAGGSDLVQSPLAGAPVEARSRVFDGEGRAVMAVAA